MVGSGAVVRAAMQVMRREPDREFYANELAPLVSVIMERVVSTGKVALNISQRPKGIIRRKVYLHGGQGVNLYRIDPAYIETGITLDSRQHKVRRVTIVTPRGNIRRRTLYRRDGIGYVRHRNVYHVVKGEVEPYRIG